ncbi:hypothetical protein [Bacillus massiliglaciei]|uniref:hypothetical protein n=1 Tax=Bacillus massiliglaciei TaxID=1816693 RepID=UPI000DA61020|nr:hypothetical protein [Bacillus massiliglaciei]
MSDNLRNMLETLKTFHTCDITFRFTHNEQPIIVGYKEDSFQIVHGDEIEYRKDIESAMEAIAEMDQT